MALEKTLLAIPAQLLSSDGGRYGQVQVPSTEGFKLKQRVILFSNTQDRQEFEVKSVVDETNMVLGPKTANLHDTSDLTLFLTATNASIYADPQDRQAIPPDKFWRAVFEEAPTVAIRTFAVDQYGRKYSKSNPFPVQLSDGSINIETLNAELRVQLSSKDDDPTPGDVHSSVRIGDQNYELAINPDRSINVHVIDGGGGAGRLTKNIYDAANSVATNTLTSIVSYTVPAGKTAILEKVSVSGDNYAKFDVVVNGTTVDSKRTWYGSFNALFDFVSSPGYLLNSADIVVIKVLHTRPFVGDFDARIQIAESD